MSHALGDVEKVTRRAELNVLERHAVVRRAVEQEERPAPSALDVPHGVAKQVAQEVTEPHDWSGRGRHSERRE